MQTPEGKQYLTIQSSRTAVMQIDYDLLPVREVAPKWIQRQDMSSPTFTVVSLDVSCQGQRKKAREYLLVYKKQDVLTTQCSAEVEGVTEADLQN